MQLKLKAPNKHTSPCFVELDPNTLLFKWKKKIASNPSTAVVLVLDPVWINYLIKPF
jgi:hypothetical protein